MTGVQTCALPICFPVTITSINVHIKNDIIITKQDCEILTDDIPKTITKIEALMATARTKTT